MIWACIKDGVVVNSIELEDDGDYDHESAGYDFIVQNESPIGSTYSNGVFTPPPSIQPEINPLYTAMTALSRSDVIVTRSYEDGVSVPPEWVAYRQALRNFIANGGIGTMPIEPEKPN